jgi:hypothetical protein
MTFVASERFDPFAASPIVAAIRGLYHVGKSINDFLDKHIEALKSSPDPLTASVGRVLEAAKAGFGLGCVVPVIVIAVGQLLLGNPLAAVATVGSAALLSNPVAMTCAAIGAIYYGWRALTEVERNAIVDRLREGLSVGVELVRSVIDFALHKMRKLLSSKQLIEIKEYIKTQAALFGRSLYQVTRKVGDLVKGTSEKVGQLAGDAIDAGTELAKEAYESTADAVASAADTGKSVVNRIGESIAEAADSTVEKGKKVLSRRKPKQATPAPSRLSARR